MHVHVHVHVHVHDGEGKIDPLCVGGLVCVCFTRWFFFFLVNRGLNVFLLRQHYSWVWARCVEKD